MRTLRNAIQSIRQNKLRSVLAGFGIAWGIFLLVIFLGVSTGFKDGVMKLFNAYAQKSLFVYGGTTSVPGSNLSENTRVFFDNNIIDEVRHRFGCVISCSPEMTAPTVNISFAGETINAPVKGVNADFFNIKILGVKNGRCLSTFDDYLGRDVTIVGEGIQKALFGQQSGVGKMLSINSGSFKIVGILASDDLFSMQERNSVYIPASSFRNYFNSDGTLSSFYLSLSPSANAAEIERDLRGFLAYRYGFDPHDDKAIYVANIETQTAAFESLFRGLELLIWAVGVCLLLSGIVGVCNVMLIVVKERTNEIGIRKAVGATYRSIVAMVLSESVTITVVSGVVGIVSGALVLMVINRVILPILDTKIIGGIHLNIPAVVVALIVLCLSGVVAGLFPALKASRITPVDAIRHENRG